MTPEEMHRVICGVPDVNGRVYRQEYLLHRWDEREFILPDWNMEREVTRPTFFEMNYDELIRLIKQPWFDSERLIAESTPEGDAKLTPADTKELDEFLNSFART